MIIEVAYSSDDHTLLITIKDEKNTFENVNECN